ncbi:xanthine phosphoribosyltransferase [Anaerosalibacter bizertensis]|uniref:Xanthine phosphoribosyltransferase n=1 Tax=Anaerosalibacter bizertensis TaxID=932217 RepID=A0A844FDV2_9FIRM|nr:xanthine phosphoribosyltransferase [Anaerosalibacter bizertensis]MBU5294664.1 xanthine phosphoribosyltransferase [Anaerosalibacter bizertensis]MSS42158.1 xanthine phosphoribosyltransferase [Anaerosalibacter bizertensis]HHV26385.1 xanthine phosphoribosyltransferase [Tissierellia bacterium]
MEILKEKILKEGRIEEGNILKVDSFLNHQLDIELLNEIGKEFKRRFKNEKITKILTIETSGIAIGAIAAQYFNVPVLFARKTESKNLDKETYESNVYSYTKEKNYKIRVAKRYLNKEDRILLIDDFLANGRALLGLKDIVEQAEATLVGAGIVIEKGFQKGGDNLRNNKIRVDSLVIIDSLENGEIKFR